MHASNSESTNAYATKGSAFGNETDSLSASDAKSLKVVTGILTAIDFEIAAARSLSRSSGRSVFATQSRRELRAASRGL